MAEVVGIAIGVAVAKKIVFKMISFTFNLFRRPMLKSIKEGDISLHKVRSMLQSQFGKLQDDLDKAMLAPLKSAQDMLNLAMIHIDNDPTNPEIRSYFRLAEEKAIDAFPLAKTFEAKLTITRIRVMCAHYLHGFFTENCNVILLGQVLEACFNNLVCSVEVQSALHSAMFGRDWTRVAAGAVTGCGMPAERLAILSSVMLLRNQMTFHTNRQYDILIEGGAILDTKQLKPEVLKSDKFISIMRIIDDQLYCIYINELCVEVWDTTTMNLLSTINLQSSVVGIAFTDSEIFMTSLYDVYVYNRETFLLNRSAILFDHTEPDYTCRNYRSNTGKDVYVLNDIMYIMYEGCVLVYDAIELTKILLESPFTSPAESFLITNEKLCVVKLNGFYVYDVYTRKLIHSIAAQGGTYSRDCMMSAHNNILCINTFSCVYFYDLNTFENLGGVDGFDMGIHLLRVFENQVYIHCRNVGRTTPRWPPKQQEIKVWDIKIRKLATTLFVSHRHWIEDMVVSDGKLYTGNWDLLVTVVAY